MGYYMNQRESNFFIPKEKTEDVFKAIKEGPEKDHPWVNSSEVKEATNLTEALEVWRWSPQFDKQGNVEALWFNGEKSGNDMVLFAMIAPFVKEKSFIEMSGEDGGIWRFCFDGEICFEDYPTITWSYS